MREIEFVNNVRKWHKKLQDDGFRMRPLRRVFFRDTIKNLGRCQRHESGDASLSFSKLLLTMSETERGRAAVKEIILHELCHAIEAAGKGHGPIWKRYAKEISDMYDVKLARFVAVDYMSEVVAAGLKLGKYKYHVTCGNGCFDVYKTRACGVTKNPKKYFCKKCKGKLKVEKL